MAHKKGLGSSKNGRDSNAQRLGIKVFGGQFVPGVIKMQHAFKTPSLRETARRGPYMHDGSLPTLAAVVAHYNEGGIDRPSKSELIAPLGLSPEEQADLVAFLTTLTSPVVPDFVPALPR